MDILSDNKRVIEYRNDFKSLYKTPISTLSHTPVGKKFSCMNNLFLGTDSENEKYTMGGNLTIKSGDATVDVCQYIRDNVQSVFYERLTNRASGFLMRKSLVKNNKWTYCYYYINKNYLCSFRPDKLIVLQSFNQ